MEQFSIRKAELSDIDEIMKIEAESFNKNIVEDKETFIKRIKTFPEGFYLLINNDIHINEKNRICGYFCSEIWSGFPKDNNSFALNHSVEKSHDPQGNVLYISSLAVKKEYRGKNLGALLFKKCIEEIKQIYRQITGQVLIVNELWENAIKIYKANGFAEYGKAEKFFPLEEEGKYSAGIMMRKENE